MSPISGTFCHLCLGTVTPHTPSPKSEHTDRGIEASRVIPVPVERLWREVSNFDRVAVWHPDVTESQLEGGATGENPGDTRTIKLRNGTTLRERLVSIEPALHTYTYSVLDGQLA